MNDMDQKDFDALLKRIKNGQKFLQSVGSSSREAQAVSSSPSVQVSEKVANSMSPEVIENNQSQKDRD